VVSTVLPFTTFLVVVVDFENPPPPPNDALEKDGNLRERGGREGERVEEPMSKWLNTVVLTKISLLYHIPWFSDNIWYLTTHTPTALPSQLEGVGLSTACSLQHDLDQPCGRRVRTCGL